MGVPCYTPARCCGALIAGPRAMFPSVGPVSETGPAQAWVKDYDFSGVTPLSLLLIHSCFPWHLCERTRARACVCVLAGAGAVIQGWRAICSVPWGTSPVVCRPVGLPWLVPWPGWLLTIIAAPWLLAVTYHQQAALALGPDLTTGVREWSQSLLPTSHASRQRLLRVGFLGPLVRGLSTAKTFSRTFELFYTLSSST